MKIQVIKENDQPKFAVVPWEIFVRFRDEIEDEVLAAEAKRVLADPVEGELVPFDVARYISNPVKAARIKAELSQEDLASRMGVSQAYVSKLEKARKVSPKVLHQIGVALAKPKRARRVLKKTGTSG